MRAADHAYFSGRRPLAFAHRGGAKTWPENTLLAFEQSIALGYRHIETDIHMTRDCVIVVHHDPTVERCTDGRGAIADMTLAELKRLDAGYRFYRDGGFPFRGKGVTIPTLEEALALHPDVRFNLEMKPNGWPIAEAVWDFVRALPTRDRERVLVASGHAPTVAKFRSLSDGSIATSAGAGEILVFWLAVKAGLHHCVEIGYQALQVPVMHGPLLVVEPRFLSAARERGLHVHVWTVDDAAEMQRLLDLGVDGLMTDYPARLREVLAR